MKIFFLIVFEFKRDIIITGNEVSAGKFSLLGLHHGRRRTKLLLKGQWQIFYGCAYGSISLRVMDDSPAYRVMSYV